MKRIQSLLLLSCMCVQLCTAQSFVTTEGEAFHTTYHISYKGEMSYADSIDALLDSVDGSLSMFNPSSVISRMNDNDTLVRADRHVRTVMEKARYVSEATHGAFDITVAPLVNLWGFGTTERREANRQEVDSILRFVGYASVEIDGDGRLVKNDPRTTIDASSIAKGYACDVVGMWLSRKGIDNYLVEIGGEIALSGTNHGGKSWGIAINSPDDDSLICNNSYQNVLHMSSGGVATSGNYRNFYYKDNKRYGHTIDPRTGYPIQLDILSATVVAPDCMTADAFATAFMVLGLEESMKVLARHQDIKAYFILPPEEGQQHYRVVCSPSLRGYLSVMQP